MISTILKKYNQGNERSIKAKKNIAAAAIIKGGSILVSLGLVPLTINYITPSEYGIWLTLSSIIVWFGFFDIGLSNGLRNKLAEALAKNDKKLAGIYISTTYAILIIIVCLVWLIFFVANYLLDWSIILNAPFQMSGELSRVALLIFSFFCLQFVLRLVGTILTADQQPAKSSLFDFAASLLSLITIFLLSGSTKGSLLTLAFITGFFQVMVLFIATVYFFTKKYAEFKPSVKLVDFRYVRPLMGLGIKFFIIQLSMVFIFQTTNLIITQLLGPEEVTVYNIAYKYFFVGAMVTGIITMPFWSAFTEVYVKADFIWMRNIAKKLNLFYICLVGLILVMLVFSNYMYKIWVGNKVFIPWSASLIMAVNMILTIRWNLFILLINGIGKIKLQLLLNVALGFLFIPVAIFFGKLYGLNGIIFSNLLINLVYAILVPIQSSKLLNQTAVGIWNK